MNVNEKQRRVLIAIAVVLAGMLLYPPFHKIHSSGRINGMGHYWLFDNVPYGASVDVAVLFTQWLGVLIIGGIAFLILKDKG